MGAGLTRRGLAAPLLFLGLACAAAGSKEASPALWLLGLSAIAAAGFALPASRGGLSILGGAVLALAGWTALTNFWSSAYTAAALYHSAFLVAGFLVARRANVDGVRALWGPVLAFGLALAGWALWQRLGGDARARAIFETPATMAAAINFALLPGMLLAACAAPRGWLTFSLGILAAGLAAAGSRGAWLSCAVALLVVSIFARQAKLPVRVAVPGMVLAGGCAFAWLAAIAGQWAPFGGGGSVQAHSLLGQNAVESSVARIDLYQLAIQGIAAMNLLVGEGYLGFYYRMEAGRAQVPSFENAATYFVHNDYLQMLLELGIPGLAGLIAIILLPLLLALRALPRLPAGDSSPVVVLACVGAMASMATHALVDFPFYIPVCLLMYGMALGILDSVLVRHGLAKAWHLAPQGGMRQAQRATVVAGVTWGAWMLATPVIAEAAAGYANRRWGAADAQAAAYWFEAARRIQPRDWRYHWYAGQFWYAQAAQHRKPEAARLADRAFAAGDSANPREVRNLLGRMATHRSLRDLLDQPADAALMRRWALAADRLSPYDPGVRRERALVTQQFGLAK